MTTLLFKNARIFDGKSADCPEGMSVLIEGDKIREVSHKAIKAKGAHVFDVKGRTLMPGLIDAHMHAYASDVNMFKVEALGSAYRTAHAVRMLGFQLDCGFTSVRDTVAATIRSRRRSTTGWCAHPATSTRARCSR